MKKIGITGGIGSGKSFVCEVLRQRGIKVYDCDAAAKRLMRTSDHLRRQLCQLVGAHAYDGDRLNKAALASFLMQSEANRLALNAVVHPAVFRDFEASGRQWVESAILFDSGLWHYVDLVVCVTAPLEVRLRRVMQRDAISRQKALDWVEQQMPQEEMAARSHFEIVNDGLRELAPQIENILIQITE